MRITVDITKNICKMEVSVSRSSKGKRIWTLKGGNAKQERGETISNVLLEMNPNIVDSIEDFMDEAVSLAMDLHEADL